MKYVCNKTGDLYDLAETQNENMVLNKIEGGEKVIVPFYLFSSQFSEAKKQEQIDPVEEKSRKYASQEKYLATRKQIRVWLDQDQHKAFVDKAKQEGRSVASLIAEWIEDYMEKPSSGNDVDKFVDGFIKEDGAN